MSKTDSTSFDLFIFFCVLTFFVFPPIFSGSNFNLTPKPSYISAFFLQVFKIFFAASFEEILYRAYLPFQINRLVCLKENKAVRIFAESIPVLLFALAHRYLSFGNVVLAFAAGIVFRLIFLAVKNKADSLIALLAVCLLHGFYNLSVYCFFWFG